jgi:hypothetical protein
MIKYVQPHVYILLFYIISRRVRSNNNNKAPETGEWVCGVGVGVRRGLRGASVPRWSA